jgi:hypothetical protein
VAALPAAKQLADFFHADQMAVIAVAASRSFASQIRIKSRDWRLVPPDDGAAN